MNKDLGEQEAIGLYHGGFLFLGISIGAIAGIILGHFKTFTDNFWLAFGVSTGIGVLLGLSLGMIKNASLSMKK